MSTPCNIAFYTTSEKKMSEFEAVIYQHEDGYPGADGEPGVISDVLPFLKWWKHARGINDSGKLAARLLQHLCKEYDVAGAKIAEVYGQGRGSLVPGTGYTGIVGYAISCKVSACSGWFYRVHPCEVRVYKIDGCLPEEEAEPVDVFQISDRIRYDYDGRRV